MVYDTYNELVIGVYKPWRTMNMWVFPKMGYPNSWMIQNVESY